MFSPFLLQKNALLFLIIALLAVMPLKRAQAVNSRALGVRPIKESPSLEKEGGFSLTDSAGLFVGVRDFVTPDGRPSGIDPVDFAVDDAVDLAYLFSMELQLIHPSKVYLVLSGEPVKRESRKKLERMEEEGAVTGLANFTMILQRVRQASRSAAEKGMLVVSFATHGYTMGGQRLLARDSSLEFVKSTSVNLNDVLETLSVSACPRKLLLLDVCREQLSEESSSRRGLNQESVMTENFQKALTQAKGLVTMAGTTVGGYSFDDHRNKNGVFTLALMEGLRGKAKYDERGFITPGTLEPYVNSRVAEWVKENQPQLSDKCRGIMCQFDGQHSRRLPLAFVDTEELREKQAKEERKSLLNNFDELSKRGDSYRIIYYEVSNALQSNRLNSASHKAIMNQLRILKDYPEHIATLQVWWKTERYDLDPRGNYPPKENVAESLKQTEDQIEELRERLVEAQEAASEALEAKQEAEKEKSRLEQAIELARSNSELARDELEDARKMADRARQELDKLKEKGSHREYESEAEEEKYEKMVAALKERLEDRIEEADEMAAAARKRAERAEEEKEEALKRAQRAEKLQLKKEEKSAEKRREVFNPTYESAKRPGWR